MHARNMCTLLFGLVGLLGVPEAAVLALELLAGVCLAEVVLRACRLLLPEGKTSTIQSCT